MKHVPKSETKKTTAYKTCRYSYRLNYIGLCPTRIQGMVKIQIMSYWNISYAGRLINLRPLTQSIIRSESFSDPGIFKFSHLTHLKINQPNHWQLIQRSVQIVKVVGSPLKPCTCTQSYTATIKYKKFSTYAPDQASLQKKQTPQRTWSFLMGIYM